MDLLTALMPKAVLFLGKCGGTKSNTIGDYILPIGQLGKERQMIISIGDRQCHHFHYKEQYRLL